MEVLGGRWRVGEVIGRGAVADVHAGTGVDGRPCAIKVIRADDAEAVARFEREVAALEGVDHAGIVAVHDHGRCADGRAYVVLDRIDGQTLEQALADGPLGADVAADLGRRLADALAHAHERGVVHRDVKPANVIIDADGRPTLVDFGIARLAGATTLTAAGWALGTPAYLAPEQVRGEDVEGAADVYALGLVVLEAATGERAFPGDGVAAAMARLDTPVPVPDGLPPALAAAIRAMTQADPAARPTAASAAARLAATSDAGATTALPIAATATTAVPVAPVVPVPDPEVPLRSSPPRRPVPGRWVIGAAAAFLLVVLLTLAGRGDGAGTDVDVRTEGTDTTLAPTTAVPTTAPPEPAPPGPAGGHGNGHGDGHGHKDR